MTLRPSISRQQYGTVSDWQEACEISSLHFYGSISDAQVQWIATFNEVPPETCDIEQDAEVIRQAAA